MGNRDSTYNRSNRRNGSFRLNSATRNVAFVIMIAAFVALILWFLDF